MGATNYAAFNNGTFTTLNIGENVKNIPDYAFNNCSNLTGLTIPDSVTSIGERAFYNCSGLATVNYNAVNSTSVGSGIWYQCSALSTVNIGENVESVPNQAFNGCTSITGINSQVITPPSLGNQTFSSEIYSTATVYTFCQALDDYRNANVWSQFANIQGDTTTNFTLTVQSQNEVMGSVTGSGNYSCEAQANLTATPSTGYRFLQWSDGNTENPRTITVTSDSTFVAMFEAEQVQQFTITVLSSNEAYGSVSGGGTYYDGDTVAISAMPYEGYSFVSWDDGDEFNPRTIVVTSDSTSLPILPSAK